MKILKIIMFFIAVLMVSCSPKIYNSKHNPPLADNATVLIVQNQKIPEQAKKLTVISIGNYDASVDCSYETVIEATKTEAKKAGGNLVQIIDYRKPDAFSSCHKITANIYKLNNIDSYNLTDDIKVVETLPKHVQKIDLEKKETTEKTLLNDTSYEKMHRQVHKQMSEQISVQTKVTDNLQNDNVATSEQKTEIKEIYREKLFKNIIKINPAATIDALLRFGGFEVDLRYARYTNPKAAVVLDFSFGTIDRNNIFVIMPGFEFIPVTHRQKSGMFLDVTMGISIVNMPGYNFNNTEIGFCAASHIGYQLTTRRGFVINPAIGFLYTTSENTFGTNIFVHYMINIGFAF